MRLDDVIAWSQNLRGFPFLFGRAFIEAESPALVTKVTPSFPFLFGRAFIEAIRDVKAHPDKYDFPSFSEGLSLRLMA